MHSAALSSIADTDVTWKLRHYSNWSTLDFMGYYCQVLLSRMVTHWARESSQHSSCCYRNHLVQIRQVADFTSGSHLYAHTTLTVHKEHLGTLWVPICASGHDWLSCWWCSTAISSSCHHWCHLPQERHLPDCARSVTATLGPHVLFCFLKDGAPNWSSIADEPWQC